MSKKPGWIRPSGEKTYGGKDRVGKNRCKKDLREIRPREEKTGVEGTWTEKAGGGEDLWEKTRGEKTIHLIRWGNTFNRMTKIRSCLEASTSH